MSETIYKFPAIRGIQAGREYYTIMCPLKSVKDLFHFNDDDVPVEMKHQRVLNKSRVPEIKNYILNNKSDYIFSSITASIDGDFEFKPYKNDDSKLGEIRISSNSTILINDGQHRKAAIEQAVEEDSDLGYETISVVLFSDRGLKQSQQMFSDLNKNAVKPNQSINILYNHRDQFSRDLMYIIDNVPIFKDLTDFEKTSISNRSNNVFTLNAIYNATAILLNKRSKKKEMSEDEKKLAFDFWMEVYENMSDWKEIVKGRRTSYDERNDKINCLTVFLHCLCLSSRDIIYKKDWKTKLKVLNEIDWKRSNPVWNGKCIINGKINTTNSSKIALSEYLSKKLGV